MCWKFPEDSEPTCALGTKVNSCGRHILSHIFRNISRMPTHDHDSCHCGTEEGGNLRFYAHASAKGDMQTVGVCTR